MATVGPIEPSAHDSQADANRVVDTADLPETIASEIISEQKAREIGPVLNSAEKAALQAATVSAAADAYLEGQPSEDAQGLASTVHKALLQDTTGAVLQVLESVPGGGAYGDSAVHLRNLEAKQEAEETWRQGVDFGDQVVAGFKELTVIPALVRLWDRGHFYPVEGFDYNEGRLEREAGLPLEDRQYLRESVNELDLDYRMKNLERRRENYKVLGAHGTGAAVAASLTGGIVDPAGWVAGLGVGKALQLANASRRAIAAAEGRTVASITSREAFAEGNTYRAVGSAAAEGAVGNVLYEAALDAAGEHVTFNDYVIAAGFGAGFGQMSLIGARRNAGLDDDLGVMAHAADAGQQAQRAAQQFNSDLYARAQKQAGEGATPEDIKREADNIQLDEADAVSRIANAQVDDIDQPFPLFDLSVNEDGTVPRLEEVMASPAERQAAARKYGVLPETMEDVAERRLVSEVLVRAERWAMENPVDADRASSIMGRVPWLASTGLTLARSDHPVARMIAGVLLESTTGATGRRRTAALTKAMKERQYLSPLTEYESAYKQWRAAEGGGVFQDIVGSQHRTRFNREVALERENRRLGVATNPHPEVRKAADALDAGYHIMAREQKEAGTIGSLRIPESSIGYAPRHINTKWIANASNAQLVALSRKLADQLDGTWADKSFARKIAARYLERARTTANGGTPVPANLASPEAASIMEDVLRSLSVSDADIELAMSRFSRGGAAHTKKRLDLDLSEQVNVPGGESFTIMDAFDMDQSKLYHQYARRVSGDVALAGYNIMGEQGMKVIRKALEYRPDGARTNPDDLRAFDQIAAEFFGKPIGGSQPVKFLDNLRLLTAASRLGGMAFTQFAEVANAVGALGVSGAMRMVKDMPRLVQDARLGRESPILSSIERVGGELGQDFRVIFPYQEADDIRVYGKDSLNAFDRMVRAGSNALPWASGWHYVHAAQVRGVSEQIVHKAMRFIREGGEDAALTSMGINPELAARLKADLPAMAEFDSTGTLVALDITKGTDYAALNEFVQAVHRGGRQIIQGTYIGETGKWAHNDFLRLLTQFRTFSITSMEKQWTRQRVDFGTAKAFGILAGQMAFALPIHLARVQFNAAGREDREEYLDTQLSPAMLARAVLNYTSMSGLASDVLDAGAAVAGYEGTGVRGIGSPLSNIPALGYLESASKSVTEKDPREAIRMLPGGNLPYLVPAFNAVD